MSDDPAEDWTSEPEKTEIPVQGDCGHIYTVPLARLRDGAEFKCPVCGQADSFDEEALRDATDKLATLSQTEPADGFATRLSAFLKSGGQAGAGNKE